METAKPDDQELVARAKAGDNAAFALLWARYEERVIALCRRMLQGQSTPDPAIDAHDLALDTFIRALHHLDSYQDRTAFGVGFQAWLLEIAKRVCLQFLAKQRRRQRWTYTLDLDFDLSDADLPFLSAADVLPEQIVLERELLRRAAQEVNALPDLYRSAFKLHLEGYSQKEIAAALGISVESAAKRIQRARRQLQPRLAALLGNATTTTRASRSLRAVERALGAVVSDYRIVTIALPTGGEMQLCLRVDRAMSGRETEIEEIAGRLSSRPRSWKKGLELAELCYHAGRWPEARTQYEKLLAVNPRCFAAVLRLGEMLRHEQQSEVEAVVYRRALAQGPPPALREQLVGRLLATERRDEEAAAAFRRAMEIDPRDKELYRDLHRTLAQMSRYEEQLANLDRLRELDPDDRLALVGAYTPCARLLRFDRAQPLLERAVSLDPADPMALKHLFQLRMNLRLFDGETLRMAERLVELAPQFVESWSELAWIYAELGRDEESLALLRQFLAEHPSNAEAHAAFAWRCHYLGRCEESARYALRAYELAPEDPYICWTLCMAINARESGVPDSDAFAIAATIAGRFPRDALVLTQVSKIHVSRERPQEALRAAQNAVAANPDAPEALGHLAYVYGALGRWEEAAATYRHLHGLPGTTNRFFLTRYAAALRVLGDPRAEDLFATARDLAVAADDDLALGEVLIAWGKRDEAIVAFRRCLARPSISTHSHILAERALRELTNNR